MHQIAADVTFTQMIAKKGINVHGEQSISAMYILKGAIGNEGDGGNGPRYTRKITKKGGLLCNKLD